MNLKILISIGLFILLGTGIWFLTQAERMASPEISIGAESEEKPEIILTSVYDNYQINPKLKTSWGFGCLIDTSAERILFDTGGDSEVLLSNLQKMDIDPKSISKVVISHIHDDHAGGLEGFLKKNSKVTVFIPASFPDSFRNMIAGKGAKFINVSEPRKISDFVYTTGELYGPPEEQSLIVDSRQGLIIITGCAHPGVVNIVEKAKKLTKKDEIYLVVGGLHRPPLSVVNIIKEIGVKKVAPSHCSGDRCRELFKEEYQKDFIEFGVGKIIKIK
ncbi:MAG: MBL fold metallo-hydrolase [Deferribacterota bacterium]|nr:MBL fold metallo-hydrolase [Deferribacterota bacterium]